MSRLRIMYHAQHGVKHDILNTIRAKIVSNPIPKNMNPIINTDHRKRRAKALVKAHNMNSKSFFVDASPYSEQKAYTAVLIDTSGICINVCSIITNNIEEAEKVDIA